MVVQAFVTDGVLRIFGTMDDDNIRIYRSMSDSSRSAFRRSAYSKKT